MEICISIFQNQVHPLAQYKPNAYALLGLCFKYHYSPSFGWRSDRLRRGNILKLLTVSGVPTTCCMCSTLMCFQIVCLQGSCRSLFWSLAWDNSGRYESCIKMCCPIWKYLYLLPEHVWYQNSVYTGEKLQTLLSYFPVNTLVGGCWDDVKRLRLNHINSSVSFP